MKYRRHYQSGGCYFFTVVAADRTQDPPLVEHIELLKEAFRQCQWSLPFTTQALVVLPEHFHWLMKLPEQDCNYSQRVNFIKGNFTRLVREKTQVKKPIWQRRFWEHCIRNEVDFKAHFDYIHYNPVKHGYVDQAKDWPWSTFHKYVNHGVYQRGWGCKELDIAGIEFD